ncbi:MAG: DUF853 family protein, partial [Gammaproteobacteria bacterium]|nr:DUF853 family protein [Gammaproteobacteria bacterium]
KGSPTQVERILIRPPQSRIGPLTDAERAEILDRSPLKGRYDTAVDRESAHELLKERAEEGVRAELAEKARIEQEKEAEKQARKEKSKGNMWTGSSRRQGVGEAIVKSVARSVGSSLGRQIVRGILGSLLGGRR